MKRNKFLLISLIFGFTLSGCSLLSMFNKQEEHTHTFSEEWSTTATHHWHASSCGHNVMSDYEEHSFGGWKTIVEPTYNEKGTESRTCTTCGYVENHELDMIPMNEDGTISETYGNLEITKLPYKNNGVVINEIVSLSQKEVKFTVINKSGLNFGNSQYASYKTYDENGYLKKSTRDALEQLDVDESCYMTIGIDSTIKRIELGEISYAVSDSCFYDGEVEDIGGLFINKLPFTDNGVCVESYSLSDRQLTLLLRNTNNFSTSTSPFIRTKKYDINDNVMTDSIHYFEQLDANESCYLNISFDRDVKRIIFGRFYIPSGEEYYTGEFDQIEGLYFNKLPYVAGDITFVSAQKINSKIEFLVKNTSSHPISRSSRIYYKTLNSDGIVLDSSIAYLDQLDVNEACFVSLSVSSSVEKIKLGRSSTTVSDAFYDGPLQELDGLLLNQLPYQSNGFTILSAQKTTSAIEFMIRNDNDFSTSMSPDIPYKKIDASGFVLDSKSVNFYPLDPGECCFFSIPIDQSVSILKIGEIFSYEYSPFYDGDLMDVEGILINSTPFTSDDLTLTKVEKNENMLNLTIVNNTELSTETYPNIYYKIINKDGYVVMYKHAQLRQLVPHELMVFSIEIDSTTAIVKISHFDCSFIS